jgi:hypothetical protein
MKIKNKGGWGLRLQRPPHHEPQRDAAPTSRHAAAQRLKHAVELRAAHPAPCPDLPLGRSGRRRQERRRVARGVGGPAFPPVVMPGAPSLEVPHCHLRLRPAPTAALSADPPPRER